MNRKILKALVQLFALVSRPGENAGRERSVVESFLKRQSGGEQLEEYLREFDELVAELHRSTDETHARKRRSASSVKVLFICTQINEELTHSQKCLVYLRLIEFLSASGEIDTPHLDFALTVASIFTIPDDETEACLKFAGNSPQDSDSDACLWIYQSNEKPKGNIRELKVEGLEAEMLVLYLKSAGSFYLRILQTSTTQLNGQALHTNRVYSLPQGAVLRGNRMSPVYYSDILGCFLQQHASQKVIFQAKNLEYSFRNGKRGLHKFSFTETSGNLIGIMGSSGAGKSTLLNLLNGNEKPSSGKILINGIDLNAAQTSTEGLIGYISQDDLLIEELSVFQNLWYNAKLCFADTSETELLRRVDHILDELGLNEIRDLKVGNPMNKTISGGQRKRLNIALELIREPAVLFVDEPTSGLSSRDSENIMDLLKELALKGKLVFVVIHQPSSAIFKMFDRLLLMDVGGYPVYYGNPVESVVYFKTIVDHANASESECVECGNVNPEQVFDILESRLVDEQGRPTSERRISPKEWNIFFKRSQPPTPETEIEPSELPHSGFKKPGYWGQFQVFFIRDLLSKLSNRQYLAINLLEAPLLALLMGYALRYTQEGPYTLFHNLNLPAYLLICVIASLFFGLTVSAEEIIRDRKIRRREKFLHLSKGSYLLSKIAILFGISAIQSACFVGVGHTMMGLHGLLADDFLILFSVSCFANLLGLNISATFNSAITIYIIIPILIIPQLLLSGVLVRFDHLNSSLRPSDNRVPLTANLMASRWAFEAMAVNRFMNNEAEKPVFDLNREISESNFMVNYWIPQMEALLVRYQESTNQEERAWMEQSLSNEIIQLNKSGNFHVFQSPEKLSNQGISEAEMGEIQVYLNQCRLVCNKRENRVRQEKEQVIRSLGESYTLRVLLATNEQLSQLVLHKDELTKIKLNNRFEFIRNFEPAYHMPDAGGFAKGGFYAPFKRFGNLALEIRWANVLVIWLMTFVLSVMLYFDGLKKLLNLPSYFRMLLKEKSSKGA
jgi:ABC-type multidrug transport system ATPase subunit